MNEPSPRFDHEKLEVYRLAVDATIRVGTVLVSSGARRSLKLEQLDRGSSGIPLNLAGQRKTHCQRPVSLLRHRTSRARRDSRRDGRS
ncbi:MAG: hypothetical protein RL885_27495 [Planctomycetota bacterium]